MRNLLLLSLLVGTAAPAIAEIQSRDRGWRSQNEDRRERPAESDKPDRDESRQQQRSQRRSDPPAERQSVQRPSVDRSPSPAAMPDSRPEIRERSEEVRRAPMPRLRTIEEPQSASSSPSPNARPRPDLPPAETSAETPRRSIRDSVREWRSTERRRDDSPTSIEQRNLRRAPASSPVAEASDGLVEPRRPLPRVLDSDRRERRISLTPAPGTEPPAPTFSAEKRAETAHRWRRDWRHDRRFDWRDHRRRHRSLFHLSFYLDPFGWSYHRYDIGWRLWPNYYSNRYWLNDPWMYRLPQAPGPYRWIRYHDDALLVNLYTGEVVDIIYDFFW